MMPHPDLLAQNTQFEQRIIPLAPRVWSAVGFAASNVHMIEGETSVTIIDTTESTEAAEHILAAFRAHTDKPVGRIIYTHAQPDHISGASVFAGDGIPILASAGFQPALDDMAQNVIAPREAMERRTQAQFGMGLSEVERISLGYGPGNRPMRGLGAGYLPPTERIAADANIDLGGVTARLILAPGQTADHMVVWLPEARILFCGDNWYHAFPNLCAVHGTPCPDAAVWAESLSSLADLGATVLAPGHTQPVFGTDRVEEVLRTTRAAILHVMKVTAKGLDEGRTLDDIASGICLPEELEGKPWLGEFHGKLAWSVRAFAASTLGWYDGNPTNLGTLSTLERAKHMAKLAGGVEGLAAAVHETDDPQWRMELCDHLIALGHPYQGFKARTMIQLAESEVNAAARNAYLWEARQLLAGVAAA